MFFGLEVIGWKLSFSVFCFYVVGRAPSLAYGQGETSHLGHLRNWFAVFLLALLRVLDVVCLCMCVAVLFGVRVCVSPPVPKEF